MNQSVNVAISPDSYNSAKVSCIPFGEKYVKVKIPRVEDRAAVRAQLLDQLELFTSAGFPDAPDGVYTWIESDKGFFATKVHSVLELGTLHSQIADKTGSTRVFVAGESKKNGKSLKFNTLSGTYSERLVTNDSSSIALRHRAKGIFDRIFDGKGFVVEDTQESGTYINNTEVPITRAELEMYKRAGYNVLVYADKVTCSPRSTYALATELSRHKYFLLEATKAKAAYEAKLAIATGTTATTNIEKLGASIKAADAKILAENEAITKINDQMRTMDAYTMFGGGRTTRENHKTNKTHKTHKTHKKP